ncbi:MAG: AMP-binding protein, partial [Rhodospirillaceae bacterium]|nr:AMP-binding protein [Rhodospirillaceae bacterium]
LTGCTPWPEELQRRYREAGYWEDITLWQMFEQSATKTPDRIALVFEDQRITYRELERQANRLALKFSEIGLKNRDRVVFQLANSPELIYAFYGLTKIGVIPVMALPAHRFTEISHFAGHAGAVGYLIPNQIKDFDYRELAGEITVAVPSVQHIIVAGQANEGQHSLTDWLAEPKVPGDEYRGDQGDPEDVALMLLSGGTTALSKLIPRTHNDFVYNCRQSSVVSSIDAKTVMLTLLPMSHNYNLGSPGILTALASGGCVVIASSINTEHVFSLIEKEQVSLILGAVPLVTKWLTSDIPEQHNLSSIKIIMNGGAKLAPELRQRIQTKFGCVFQESFGMGEGLLNLTRLNDEDEVILHSSGRPMSPGDEIKIVDENGNEVADGEKGELTCRGPYTIQGYYYAPESSANAFSPDGFYHTGDLVCRRNGYLYVEGRIKDLINRGGEKVSIDEVENHILADDRVENVSIVAMPDAQYGEKACAFVKLKAGQKLTREELTSFLLDRGIAKFKLPERLEIVESFPLSPAGKILRRELRRIIEETIKAEQESEQAKQRVSQL